MGEKAQLFLLVELQWINVKGKIERENYPLTNNRVTVVAGKNHQLMLNL